MDIEFSGIRLFKGSQADAFEELVCQIVRRTDAANDATWRRLDGAGGDGGVEAFYDRADGRIGLQAKYFLKTADIGWSQIEKSFKAALANHSTLIAYHVYLACDLTGPTGRGGSTGIDGWKTLHSKLQKHAQDNGRSVEIVPRTASDILGQMIRPECVGLAEFWFGAIEFTPDRLRHWLDFAIRSLGERYHPDDHVEVSTQQIARMLARNPLVREELGAVLADLSKARLPESPSKWITEPDASAEAAAAQQALSRVVGIADDADLPCESWPVRAWRLWVDDATSAMRQLHRRSLNVQVDKEQRELRSDQDRIYEVLSRLSDIRHHLETKGFDAECERAAVVIGPAGSGKSHLLAASADEILTTGGICLLFLGQRFANDQLWPQILGQLGFSSDVTPDRLLGALDAAAMAARRRAVVIVDAVNEGGLRRIWRQEFDPFVAAIKAHKNLAVVASCRDVFVPQVLGSDVENRYPCATIEGFSNPAEQERAAQVYMDKRGITRPAVPWLAPEFVNPLFLRSCCDALALEGKHEFPAGLIGTKRLMNFYTTALSSSLSSEVDVQGDLSKPTKQSLFLAAKQMASDRQDWMDRSTAAGLIAAAFQGYGTSSIDWLSALIRVGIFREDPHPDTLDDPLCESPDVIRFSFQRFQDHLMAESLLDGASNAKKAFGQHGLFAFLYSKQGHLKWEWNGLLEALAIQVPEKFGQELVDVLWGGAARHWYSQIVQDGFVSSIRWREGRAVGKRAGKLAETLDYHSGIFSLLIELAPRVDHPWNADFLDTRLREWKRWERDRSFSSPISFEALDADHPVNRLLDWCAAAPKEKADPEALRLCAIVLTWLGASLAPELRDRATKALSSVLTDAPELLVDLIAAFADVDDLYVVERLLAAGYGMLQRHGDKAACEGAATAVLKHVFSKKPPPEHLLMRDYAAGIVELARARFDFSSSVIGSAEPPYGSPPVKLSIDKTSVQALAKKAGGDDILDSSTSDMHDFYKNDVRYRVEEFSRIRLTTPLKPNMRQLAYQFEEMLQLQGDGAKWQALNDLSSMLWKRKSVRLEGTVWLSAVKAAPAVDVPSDKDIEKAESRLLSLLDREETRTYREIWLARQIGDGWRVPDIAKQSASGAGLWIAREAYRMGWTQKRFGSDPGRGDSGYRDAPTVERIGKKYQWIARSKLLARLADNYWIVEGYDDGSPRSYRYATDVSFDRDIDPTLYDHPSHLQTGTYGADLGLVQPPPAIEEIDGEERMSWPLSFTFEDTPCDDPVVIDRNGERWLRLSWYASATRSMAEEQVGLGHGQCQQEFYFINAVLCDSGYVSRIQVALHEQHLEVDDWDPIQNTDGPYLYEYWRPTWPCRKWRGVTPRQARGAFRLAFPVEQYRWESHLDRTLPEGGRGEIMAPWIMEGEQLRLSSTRPDCIEDRTGRVIAWSGTGRENSGFVVREDWFNEYLAKQGVDCIWITIGERNAFRNGSRSGGVVYRRFNSVVHFANGTMVADRWSEDTDRRDSE